MTSTDQRPLRIPWPRVILAVILLAAAAVRLWAISAGVPHAANIDEPVIAGRVLRILATGDWNPHIFDYPTLVLYLHACVAILRFLAGASAGEWTSIDGFDVADLYLTGRVLTALLGVATVWLTYRIGRDAGSERVGLLAAAQLAVLPMHVRESHFMLTDVPLTALTTASILLATQLEGARPSLAGVVAGLAAAAKYTGGIALIAVVTGLLAQAAPATVKLRGIALAAAGAFVAFLAATPYSVLDLPTFLDSFAAQMSRFAGTRPLAEPPWLTYLKHFAISGRLWLPFAAVGLAVVLVSVRRARAHWLPTVVFGLAFYYVLATHPLVFARYALPLTPVVCLLAAAGIDGIARFLTAMPWLRRRSDARAMAGAALALLVLVPFIRGWVDWTRQFERRDTRQVAVDWLRAAVPKGTRLAVENSGPTHLAAAGFKVTEVELLIGQPAAWYREQGIEYLVVSSGVAWEQGYADAGVTAVDVPNTPQRPGPPIRIVRLMPPQR